MKTSYKRNWTKNIKEGSVLFHNDKSYTVLVLKVHNDKLNDVHHRFDRFDLLWSDGDISHITNFIDGLWSILWICWSLGTHFCRRNLSMNNKHPIGSIIQSHVTNVLYLVLDIEEEKSRNGMFTVLRADNSRIYTIDYSWVSADERIAWNDFLPPKRPLRPMSEHFNPSIGSLWTVSSKHRFVFIVSSHQDPISKRNVFGAMYDDGKLLYANRLAPEWIRVLWLALLPWTPILLDLCCAPNSNSHILL